MNLRTRDGSPWSEHIERLAVIRGRVQDIEGGSTVGATSEQRGDSSDGGFFRADRVVVVLPHAHVGLDETLHYVRWRDALGAIVLP